MEDKTLQNNNTETEDQIESTEKIEEQADNSKNEESEKQQKEYKYTDADVDAIVKKRLKRAEEKAREDVKKEIDEAKKLASMNEKERAEHERDKLQKELDELRADKARSEMSKTARAILREKNIDVNDDLLSVLVTKEAESTKTNVESFIKMFDKAVEKEVNERLKGKAPKLNVASKSGTTLTKEDILNIKDRAERQQKIAEHIELFN